jgi:hypothetical protein
VVECHLAKVDVEGSNPFSRSVKARKCGFFSLHGGWRLKAVQAHAFRSAALFRSARRGTSLDRGAFLHRLGYAPLAIQSWSLLPAPGIPRESAARPNFQFGAGRVPPASGGRPQAANPMGACPWNEAAGLSRPSLGWHLGESIARRCTATRRRRECSSRSATLVASSSCSRWRLQALDRTAQNAGRPGAAAVVARLGEGQQAVVEARGSRPPSSLWVARLRPALRGSRSPGSSWRPSLPCGAAPVTAESPPALR